MAKGKLNYSIDRTTGVPPFLQIVEQVKDSLHAGRLEVVDHLPSVSEVVKMTAVNANTVMKAYRELEYVGIAQPIQGVGTVVTSLPSGANPQLLKSYQSRFEELITKARPNGHMSVPGHLPGAKREEL